MVYYEFNNAMLKSEPYIGLGSTYQLYWNGQLVWTPALGLYLCVGEGLCPGYTGISARRRYQFWERDLSPTFKRISDRICAASITG